MNRWMRFLRGYVTLLLIGKEPERFLNLCSANGIVIWELLHRDEGYQMKMSVGDYFRLQPLCRKTRSRIRILQKRGMPFFFQKSRKRKAFFLGVLLFVGLLYLLSCFIWNIHVDGNYANSTYSILEFLETRGIRHGIPKSRVDCAEIAAAIREEFSNVTWVSAKMEGTRLILELKENVDGYRADESPAEDQSPCDLVAAEDGVIVSIFTRTGVPQVRTGDSCKKGDILVSGKIPVNDDSGETIRNEYVRSDADIIIESSQYYYDEFSLKHTVRTYDEKTRTAPFLQLFNYRLNLGGSMEDGSCDYLVKEHEVYLTENFVLPILYGTVEVLPYSETQATYTDEEARALAQQRLEQFCGQLEKSGVEISENNVTIELSGSKCITKGTLSVRKQAVDKTPCTIEELIPPGKEES